MFLSIHGPTLLTLANNVGSTTGQVSWLFSGRSIGLLAGGVSTGYLMRKTNNTLLFGMHVTQSCFCEHFPGFSFRGSHERDHF